MNVFWSCNKLCIACLVWGACKPIIQYMSTYHFSPFPQVIGPNSWETCVAVSPDGYFKTSCYSKSYICARPKGQDMSRNQLSWNVSIHETTIKVIYIFPFLFFLVI